MLNANSLSSLLFTDGACSGNPGPGGWAFVSLSADKNVKESCGADPSTTNNRMEMSAILNGLRHLASLRQNEILIFTDSVYVIKGIQQWIHSWKKNGWLTKEGKPVSNREIWVELDEVVRDLKAKKINLVWQFVRGHSGTPGNERCDELSRQCSQQLDPTCFEGPLEMYDINLYELPSAEELPSTKPGQKNSPTATSYLSYIDQKLEEHKTWKECESRVKGRPGAKFKKVSSVQERQETLKKWGLHN